MLKPKKTENQKETDALIEKISRELLKRLASRIDAIYAEKARAEKKRLAATLKIINEMDAMLDAHAARRAAIPTLQKNNCGLKNGPYK